MKIKQFEDLKVWQISMKLTIDLYQAVQHFKDFGLRDQIKRSAISIPSNIAEGFDRRSNKEYLYFLSISRGSCAELRTQLCIAKEINLMDHLAVASMIDRTKTISAMLSKLIQVRNNFK